MKTSRKAAFALITLLLVVVAPLALLELGARGWMRLRYGRPGKTYGLHVADDELGAVLGANRYSHQFATNDVAMRGNENLLEPKPAGSLRILCYGGSTTFGYNLADGETWPEQLQRRLRAMPGHERDQVLNGGHVAWSLGHLVRQARRDLPVIRPDVVIIYSGVNEELNAAYLRDEGLDLDALLARGEFGAVATTFPFTKWHHRHLVLGRLLARLVPPSFEGQTRTPPASGDSPEWRQGWPCRNYMAMLDEMIGLVRAQGARPLFVIEAGVFDRTRSMRRYSAAGAEEAERLGVATCDPRPALERGPAPEKLFADTGIHPTAEGAQILADAVLPCLLAENPAPDAPAP